MAFQLSSHEVMRGIKVRDGRLVLKPWGGFYAGSFVDVAIALGLTSWAIVAGGLWLLAVPWTTYATVDSIGRCRVAVMASPEELVVRNRFRTHRCRLDQVRALGAGEVEWYLRGPVMILNRSWGWPTQWQVAWVDIGGRRVHCDALVSSATSEHFDKVDPTPTEMKVDTLRRWVAEHRTGGS